MPYIKDDRREILDPALYELNKALANLNEQNCGDLNYIFTKIALAYFGEHMSYQKINDIMGAFECCKLELYRRFFAKYEDMKIRQNRDVI